MLVNDLNEVQDRVWRDEKCSYEERRGKEKTGEECFRTLNCRRARHLYFLCNSRVPTLPPICYRTIVL